MLNTMHTLHNRISLRIIFNFRGLKTTHAVIGFIQGHLHNGSSSCQHQVTTSIVRHTGSYSDSELRQPSSVRASPNHMTALSQFGPRWNLVSLLVRDVRLTYCRHPVPPPRALFCGSCACLPGLTPLVSASLAPGAGWLYQAGAGCRQAE